MSEFALSSPEENQKSVSSLLLSDFHIVCSFVCSHPFYCSYLVFFSLYFFKILSFLSPLFVTTTLLLLALLTTLHFSDSESPETQPSFLFSFSTVLEPKFGVNDELGAAAENESMEICSDELIYVDKFCSHESTVSTVEIQALKSEEETEKCEKEEEKVKPKSGLVLVNGEGKESKARKVDFVRDCNNDLPKLSDFLGEEKKKEEDVGLKNLGSMRKEKEWRRTLACKLFEERHNADVGQGMDQLWETYDTETDKKQIEEEKKLKKKNSKSIEREEEEDEDGIDQQQLCCLQALKLSTAKMHLGISKPNLVKLTKAFKGFGRFYKATKHHKKA